MSDPNTVEQEILSVIVKSGGTAAPADVLQKLAPIVKKDAGAVEEAMQSLFDRGKIEVTLDWRLHATA